MRALVIVAMLAALFWPAKPYRVGTALHCSDPVQARHYIEYGADEAARVRANSEVTLFEPCQRGTIAYGKPLSEEPLLQGRRRFVMRQVLVYGREQDGRLQMFDYPVVRYIFIEWRLQA